MDVAVGGPPYETCDHAAVMRLFQEATCIVLLSKTSEQANLKLDAHDQDRGPDGRSEELILIAAIQHN